MCPAPYWALFGPINMKDAVHILKGFRTPRGKNHHGNRTRKRLSAMVLRADPGVTLPGLILGSSIIWGITWDEPLLSISFRVCNGSIAGVPQCYEDRLGYYKRSPLHVLIIHQSRRVGSKEQLAARVLSDQQGMCPLSRVERGGQRNPSFRLLRNRRFWCVPLWS